MNDLYVQQLPLCYQSVVCYILTSCYFSDNTVRVWNLRAFSWVPWSLLLTAWYFGLITGLKFVRWRAGWSYPLKVFSLSVKL